MRKLNEETIRKMEGYIREKQRREGRSPSFRNIMHALGMSSLNLVQRYVVALERQGRINRTDVGRIALPQRLDTGRSVIVPLSCKLIEKAYSGLRYVVAVRYDIVYFVHVM